MECALGRVPKKNPDRTVSDEWRLIHDPTEGVNLVAAKERHPRVVTPKHAHLSARILYWQKRYPEVPLLLSKPVMQFLAAVLDLARGTLAMSFLKSKCNFFKAFSIFLNSSDPEVKTRISRKSFPFKT